MDLEGWEILPEYGFLEIHDDGGKTLPPVPVDDHGGGVSEMARKINLLPEQEVSQVFFKKMKESEFTGNTKMESPRSSSSKKSLVPKMDVVGDAYRMKAMEGGKNDQMDAAVQQNGGLNIWRWSLNGFGAICSFGVAAATLCIIFIGTSQKHRQQNQKLCLQICTDDQRIKKVVHPATKLDEAN